MKISKQSLSRCLLAMQVFFVVCLAAYLLSLIVATNETITDARNYYYFYNLFLADDLPGFLARLTSETGKLEPAIYLLVFTVFGPMVSDMQSFAFACTFSVMFLLVVLARVCAGRNGFTTAQIFWFAVFSIVIFVFWYPSYSSVLWVWRSHLAFTLVFLIFVINRAPWTIVLLPVAFLLHYSGLGLFLVVWMFDFLMRRIGGVSRGVKFLAAFGAGGVASMLVGYLKRAIVSGDGDWSSSTSAGIYVYIYVALFTLAMLPLYRRLIALQAFSPRHVAILDCFFAVALFFVGLSLTSSSSHQDLMRIMQPVFIVLPICFLLVWARSLLVGRMFLFLMLSPGILMGLKSISTYLEGAM
ncbi:hypothetical protein ABE525_18365 [Pseudomonas wadenswilerensis]|uniref:hypothetical protein n=1 Tax=Pseudomonas wadenswilerensis TaxID=1785161 RepID=UPI003207DFA7